MPVPSPSPGRRRVLILGALLACAATAACTQSTPPPEAVTLDFARAELEAGRVVLIDIREPQEHATGVAQGARLLPMGQIRDRLAEIPKDPGTPVLLVCNTQNRSSAVTKALRENGYGNVRYVAGGMSEWVRRGWPVVPPAQ